MLIHPFDKAKCFSRLISEYQKYDGKLIVAFDFDNTIFDYHNEGGNYSRIINLLKECSDMGFIMILFTCDDSEDSIEWKKKYCSHYGIKIDYINESPILNTKKPYYNVLLDDRAGIYEVIDYLEQTLYVIKCNENT